MTGQNALPILLLSDANIIGQHLETKMKMMYGYPFENPLSDQN